MPITPDATGYVAPGSNSVAIHGSFFMYSDCNDGIKPCSTITTPTSTTSFPNVGGLMCTSGTTVTETGTAANAWGAGMGLELNDGPPQQPYDATTYNIKGFCFVLSGPTLPSTGLRVAFTTKENQDYAPFETVTTAGVTTVLFSNIAQGSWVSKADTFTFDPTEVMLMQWQVPGNTTAPIPWDFCVQGVTAITE
ncbi:MAG: hypothetical protein ABTD50_08440 [Polyangiaceae bacterium]